jgi:hypothetical protein
VLPAKQHNHAVPAIAAGPALRSARLFPHGCFLFPKSGFAKAKAIEYKQELVKAAAFREFAAGGNSASSFGKTCGVSLKLLVRFKARA